MARGECPQEQEAAVAYKGENVGKFVTDCRPFLKDPTKSNGLDVDSTCKATYSALRGGCACKSHWTGPLNSKSACAERAIGVHFSYTYDLPHHRSQC